MRLLFFGFSAYSGGIVYLHRASENENVKNDQYRMKDSLGTRDAEKESPFGNNFGTSRIEVHRQIISRHSGDKTPNAEMKLMGFLKMQGGA